MLQKRTMRTITNSWYRAHTTPIFKSLNRLKINDLYWLMVLKFYYKLENKLLPTYFDEFISKTISRKYNLFKRNPQNQREKSFMCELTKITNIINNSDFLRDIFDNLYTHSLHGYSHHIKNKLIHNYTTDCLLENCYTCRNYHNLILDAYE